MLTWLFDLYVDRQHFKETSFLNIARQRGHKIFCFRENADQSWKHDLSSIIGDECFSSPTIVRGAVDFATYISDVLEVYPGPCFHPENFKPSEYTKYVGDFCLNNDITVMTYGEFIKNRPAGKIFVKPLEHFKLFTGLVLEEGDVLDSTHYHKFRKWNGINSTDKLCISPAFDVFEEYRVVVVDKKPITASSYKIKTETIPECVYDLVTHVSNLWVPHDVFVVDVCRVKNDYKIIEYNQFSTSGMYNCDQCKIVDALENLYWR